MSSLDWLENTTKKEEKTETPKTPKTPKPPKTPIKEKKYNKNESRYIEGLSKQLKSFGKIFHLDEMQEILNWFMNNKNDLYTAVDQYLRTYNNPKRDIKTGGIVDLRNKRLQQVKEDLLNFPQKPLKVKY